MHASDVVEPPSASDALTSRIAALEARLSGWPGNDLSADPRSTSGCAHRQTHLRR